MEPPEEAAFPRILRIFKGYCFNKTDPIFLEVNVVQGTARVGSPICIPSKDFIDIGQIASIKNNHMFVDYAKKGHLVMVEIIGANTEEQGKIFGRHFDEEDEPVSRL